MSPPVEVFIAGPVAWNLLIYLTELPRAEPQMISARRYTETVGGTSAGKTMNLCRLGASVTLRTVVGDDRYASTILDSLRAEGAHVLAEVDRAGGSERHVNLMSAAGARVSLYLSVPAVPERPQHTGATVAAMAAARVLVLDLAESARDLIPAARDSGVPIWTDLHDYNGTDSYHTDFADAASVIFLSSDRLPDLRQFMTDRIAAGADLVVCTHGSRGATAIDAVGTWYDTAAAPVTEVVDTNGAGDAFFSAFLLAQLGGASVPEALAAAAGWAAKCVGSPELAPVR